MLHPAHGIPSHPTNLPGAIDPASHSAAPRSGSTGTGWLAPKFVPAAPRTDVSTPDVPVLNATGWDGINYTSSGCSCAPPDVQIAVGPTAIDEMTNLEEAVYSTTGTLLNHENLSSIFLAPPGSLSDPRILYDNLSGRWFASIADISSFTTLLAVSSSSDPLGSWVVYSLPTNGSTVSYPVLPDEPYLGVSSTMVSVSRNDYNTTTSLVEGTEYSVLNKSAMLAGQGVAYHSWGPFVGGASYYPNARAVDALTPTDLAYFQLVNPSSYYVSIVMAGVPPALPTMTVTSSLLGAVDSAPPPAAQPGTSYTLDTSDGRIQSAVWQNGIVTTALVDSCNGGLTGCARITQAYTSNSTIIQDSSWLTNYSFTYVSATVDGAGNILLSVGLSSAILYPSFGTAAILQNEPGYADGWIVRLGSASWTAAFACNASDVCRYGDYFGAANDPMSNTVWVAGEYLNTTPLWSTWIESAVAAPLSVRPTAAPTTIDIGQSADYSAFANGGSGSYTFQWTNLPSGCNGTATAVIVCTPTSTGTFTAFVNVTDLMGVTVMGEATLIVHSLPTLAVPTATASAADVGQTVTFTSAVPSGGTAPFSYIWTGLPSGCGANSSATVTCTFTGAATLELGVNVTDSVGGSGASPTLAYVVSPRLVLGTPTASPHSADRGKAFTFSVVVSGGSGGNQYAWSGLPPGCSSSDAASVGCTPNATGKFMVTVAVTDSNGAHVTSAGVNVTVTQPSSTAGLFGLSGSTGYILVGALLVVVIAAIVVGLLLRRRRRPGMPAPTGPQPSGATPPPGAVGDSPPPPPPTS